MPRLQSLKTHTRIRRLAERLAAGALEHSGSPSVLAPPPSFQRELGPQRPAPELAPVSHLLFARLSTEDVTEVRRRLHESPELLAHYNQATTKPSRETLTLIAGAWLGVPGVIEKTGLTAAQPPEDVHAMARGPLAAGGGFYEADMIVEVLANAGLELDQLQSALDFGCSSGRVLRTLSAAYPTIAWSGCDPNAPAVAWAGQQLPDANLFVSGDEPPLPLGDGSVDLVYAISIWSHFSTSLGVGWFEEMRRVIRPGGHLLCTTHGWSSVALYAALGHRTPEQSRAIADSMYMRGFWYAAEFGAQGDWGVVNPDWGTAFLSPEWMLTHLCPSWQVIEFAPGRNQDNQDVYVLRRA